MDSRPKSRNMVLNSSMRADKGDKDVVRRMREVCGRRVRREWRRRRV